MHRLETEAKTIGEAARGGEQKSLAAGDGPPAVEEGYEKALGAALGDDLDAPVGDPAPMRWAGAAIDPADPALPAGVEALCSFVTGAAGTARRLAEIGVVARAEGARLAGLLKPGQRLVSREGDLWRWDGFAVAAHAPTGAARRLAGRGLLADNRGRVGNCARRGRGASAARSRRPRRPWPPPAAPRRKLLARAQPSATDAARERHAAAERENSALRRASGAQEARARFTRAARKPVLRGEARERASRAAAVAANEVACRGQ